MANDGRQELVAFARDRSMAVHTSPEGERILAAARPRKQLEVSSMVMPVEKMDIRI